MLKDRPLYEEEKRKRDVERRRYLLKVVPEGKVLGRMSVKMGRVEWEGRWFVFHWKFRYLCIDEGPVGSWSCGLGR